MNITLHITPQGMHFFGYGNLITRGYANLLRDMKWIYNKEVNALEEELWQLFPDFDRGSIVQKRAGLLRIVDTTMQFPGNAWKQRLEAKAPAVDGLYFVGDIMRGWGGGTDLAAHSGILCAESIHKHG